VFNVIVYKYHTTEQFSHPIDDYRQVVHNNLQSSDGFLQLNDSYYHPNSRSFHPPQHFISAQPQQRAPFLHQNQLVSAIGLRNPYFQLQTRQNHKPT
jgi:hypothetical protein